MFYQETIPWITGCPLGIRIRKIGFVPTHMHEDLVEIIFCLRGSIKFSYAYEEFTLTAGEFISVDKDAHFLYSEDENNICVSFYLDLKWFLEKYPFITSLLFVCEATKESSRPYPTEYHKQLKGILIAILFYLANRDKYDRNFQSTMIRGAERIADLLVDHFDIIYYYNPGIILKDDLMERNRNMMVYLAEHSTEKLTLEIMSADFNLAKSYISEFLRTYVIGFRNLLSYIRANNSEKMLLTTDRNIMDISEACGFSDPQYYYRSFKKWYKCTPREFRTIYRNKMDENSRETELDFEETLVPLNEMILNHHLDLFLT